MNSIPNDVDRLGVVFDDGSLVADAGLLVAGTLMSRLGLERLLDETVRLGDRVGGIPSGSQGAVFGGVHWWAGPILIMLIGCGPVPRQGAGVWGEGDRSPPGSLRVDDLAGVAS